MAAPPAYDAVPDSQTQKLPDQDLGIEAPFTDLQIDPAPHDPEPNICLAHLRLLFAFESLKEDIGYSDGLFGIWDSRADGTIIVGENGDLEELPFDRNSTPDLEDKKQSLSKLREKRWSLFVARAVDRYEAWWNTLPQELPLLTVDAMYDKDSPSFVQFVSGENPSWWDKKALPPLDVLMVYHSHMLNPHNFLEDCLRKGLRQFWQSGMPWGAVNAAIDGSFNYNVSDDDKARWVSQTGREWENAADPMSQTLNCPNKNCNSMFEVPWTTCALEENPKTPERPGLLGTGYGDAKFETRCPKCNTKVTKEVLSVVKFCGDANDVVLKNQPMPGTLLWPGTGIPVVMMTRLTTTYNPRERQLDQRTFPNRMIQLVLRVQIQRLLDSPDPDNPPTMETVRKLVETEALMKQSAIKTIQDQQMWLGRVGMSHFTKITVRKMMSRYWENFSPFALDLTGAVMRQSVFSEKMCKLDWLHSPTARETMNRCCVKYKRFIKILSKNPRSVVVPTLDIDLAWHTHQLSPLAYYHYTTRKASMFVRHDDKIEDNKLNDGFEWTITDRFYESGQADRCPPDNSAHISSHNAVRSSSEALLASNQVEKVQNRMRAVQNRRLEENYRKACKRAEKKGRKLPPKDQYYNHWGYPYM
ncbi:hypothetical protein FLONG3_600, partial [Fusarium longipes]